MRLLKYDDNGKVTLTEDLLNEDAIPPYAILSHTWGNEEVAFEELTNGSGELKDGYKKIRFCMEQAAKDGIHHSWVDTCCIKKTDTTELQHAINSMFRWYKEAVICYVFLTDVSSAKRKADSESCQQSWEPAFRDSRWFTRGWTLQELLAPRKLKFFSREGNLLGDIYSLKGLVHSITRLPIAALEGASTDEFSIEERLTWTKDRKTTREEDKAYSLLGIFGIYMPLIYGEREKNAFRRLRKEIQERRYTTQASLIFSERDFACLQSLSYPEQEHRHNDIHRATGTCDWLLQDSKYNLWMKRSHGILWVRGDPGSGKSVLMKHAVRSTVAQFTKEIVVSYFIHGQGSELQQTPLGVYRALLNSLLGHFPACLSKLATIFGDREARFGGYMMGRWSWSSNELQESLTDLLVHHTQQHQVTIFVDALDECGEGPARELMAYFSHLTKQAGDRQAKVRICVSSRYYPILALDDLPSISVEERNNEDIRWFVNDRLSAIHSSPIRQKVLEEIMFKAQGGFQWALLVTDLVLDRKFSGRSVLGQVASCPSTLSELYASLLDDGTESEKRQAVKLFRWIIFAQRPLSAQELREALATDPDMRCTSVVDMRKREEWSETLEDFERYVTFISKGLVKFESREIWEQWEESSHEAQLIHQSVADFLLKDFLHDDRQSSACAGHFLISRSCLKYLTLTEISSKERQERDKTSSGFPLGPYAVRHVFDHIRSAEQAGCNQIDLLSAMKWSPESETVHRLANIWVTLNPHHLGTPSGWPFIGSSECHVLAALGSKSAWLAFSRNKVDAIRSQDSDGNTPLHIALAEDNQEVVSLILSEYRAWKRPTVTTTAGVSSGSDTSISTEIEPLNLDAQNFERETALDVAVSKNAHTAVRELLELGASTQRMDQPHLLLFSAITNHDEAMLTKLIADGLDLRGALYIAVESNSAQTIVLKLLNAGATPERLDSGILDFEDDDDDYDSFVTDNALHLACRNASADLVDLLLCSGVSATSYDLFGRLPIHAVVTINYRLYDGNLSDYLKVLRSLLKANPSIVELDNRRGHSALHTAIEFERESFIDMILELGQFSVPSPTLTRLFGERSTIKELILKSDGEEYDPLVRLLDRIDPNSIDGRGRTVLWKAASEGFAAITKDLAEKSAVSLNTVDASGASPLLAAVRNRHAEVAEALISVQGINVNIADKARTTPLHEAVRNGDHGTVKLLLSVNSINVNVKDKEGLTPLVKAIQNGHETISEALLERNDIPADEQLLAAITAQDYTSVEHILIRDPNVNARFWNGMPLLSLAITGGHKSIVEILLQQEHINVNAKNDSGDSPICTAIRYERIASLELLLSVTDIDICPIYRPDVEQSLRLMSQNFPGYLDMVISTDSRNGPRPRHALLRAALKCKDRRCSKSLLSLAEATIDHKELEACARTALLDAIGAEDEDAIGLLLSDHNLAVEYRTEDFERSILTMALRIRNTFITKLLVEAMYKLDSFGDKLLWTAALRGHTNMVRLLLDTEAANVNLAVSIDFPSLLWWAAQEPGGAIFKILLANDRIDIDVTNEDGETLLLRAVKAKDRTLIRSLLWTRRLDIDRTDRYGMSAMMYAEQNGDTAMAEMLRAYSRGRIILPALPYRPASATE